jgi:hypothetical protein
MIIEVLHADHGISNEQLEFIEAQLEEKAPEGFFILQIDIPEEMGSVPNALKGPACGDPPVEDGPGVFYEKRGDREWEDRMTFGKFRPCSYVQAIGTRAQGKLTVFTIYGGPLAPQNPEDPSNADPAAAEVFWKEHALLTGYTLERAIAAELNAHMHED